MLVAEKDLQHIAKIMCYVHANVEMFGTNGKRGRTQGLSRGILYVRYVGKNLIHLIRQSKPVRMNVQRH